MSENIKKIGIPSATAIITSALLLMTPILAAAASPHFVGTPTIFINSNGSSTATFKVFGLGSIPTAAFLTSSGGTATLKCTNPDGTGSKLVDVTFGLLRGRPVTINPNNGQITASASIGPPPLPSASEICPNSNWSVQLVAITYVNVVLHIQQNFVDILIYKFGTVHG
jgi:hypothetical protein